MDLRSEPQSSHVAQWDNMTVLQVGRWALLYMTDFVYSALWWKKTPEHTSNS